MKETSNSVFNLYHCFQKRKSDLPKDMAINNRDFRTSHLPAPAKQHENTISSIMKLVILLYCISQASLTAIYSHH